MPPVQPPPGNPIVLDDPFGPPVPVHFNGQQYLNLPQDLVQWIQDVAAFLNLKCKVVVVVMVKARVNSLL